MNENSKGKSRLFILLIAAVIVGVAASILFKFGLILIPAYSFTLAAFVVVFDILFFIVMHPYINKNSVSGFYMMFAVLAASFSTFWGNNNLMNFFCLYICFPGTCLPDRAVYFRTFIGLHAYVLPLYDSGRGFQERLWFLSEVCQDNQGELHSIT